MSGFFTSQGAFVPHCAYSGLLPGQKDALRPLTLVSGQYLALCFMIASLKGLLERDRLLLA